MKIHRPANTGLDVAAFAALMILAWTLLAFAPEGWLR